MPTTSAVFVFSTHTQKISLNVSELIVYLKAPIGCTYIARNPYNAKYGALVLFILGHLP